jgi:hypothetical protein
MRLAPGPRMVANSAETCSKTILLDSDGLAVEGEKLLVSGLRYHCIRGKEACVGKRARGSEDALLYILCS